jgi:hypothetical protein
MDFTLYRDKLIASVYSGVVECIETNIKGLGEAVYALVLYGDSGCTSVGLSVSTRESIERIR